MHSVDASLEVGNGGAIVARTADAYAEQDRERKAMLDALVKRGGRCVFCGSTVSDAVLARTPEVCGSTRCQKKARAESFVSDLPTAEILAGSRREMLAAAGFHLRPSPEEERRAEIAAAVDARAVRASEREERPGGADMPCPLGPWQPDPLHEPDDVKRAERPGERAAGPRSGLPPPPVVGAAAAHPRPDAPPAARLAPARDHDNASVAETESRPPPRGAQEGGASSQRPARGEAVPAASAPSAAGSPRRREPMGKHAPCEECGSGSRHKKTCSKVGARAKKNRANGVVRQLREVPPEAAHGCDPKLLSDEDLAACVVEAKRRLETRHLLAEALGE